MQIRSKSLTLVPFSVVVEGVITISSLGVLFARVTEFDELFVQLLLSG